MNQDKLLVEGVTYDKDNDAFVFDFQHDSETDLVKIVSDGPYQLEDYEPCTYFGYVFEDSIDSRVKKQFIDFVKSSRPKLDGFDLNRFAQRSVASLDKKISLPKYDVLVHKHSFSRFGREILAAIYSKALNTHCIEFDEVDSTESEYVFETCQDKKILVVDTIATPQSKLKHVLSTIRAVNDTCDITMFCLLGNKVR